MCCVKGGCPGSAYHDWSDEKSTKLVTKTCVSCRKQFQCYPGSPMFKRELCYKCEMDKFSTEPEKPFQG